MCLLIWAGAGSMAIGQTAENVAIVVNDNSADSQRIAEHYVHARGLPESNVLRIKTSTDELIERESYLKTIEQPIGLSIKRAGLQDRLLYIVLTKGVPLRIVGSSGVDGSLSSVDSELTLLYRRLVGQSIATSGKIDNPYFLGERPVSQAFPFTHRQHDIYLVTRLDAYTVEQVLALIDRAQAPAAEGMFVFDRHGNAGAASQWIGQAADRLTDQGHKTRALDVDAAGEREAPALGFYSARPGDYASAADTVAFAPGSIAATFGSFDARTFQPPPDGWRPTQSGDKKTWFEGSGAPLIGDLIRDGVTGVAGQIGEPYVAGAVRPQILFPAYLAGFNLAEAFYLSIPALSWQTVVIGDPLCAAVQRNSFGRMQLEDANDGPTGLPGLFAKRRLAVLRAGNPELPGGVVTLFARAQTALERNDTEAGRRALDEAVGLAPRAAALITMLAQLEEQAGETDAAIGHYEQALQVQPENVVVLNNLAYALAVYRHSPADALPLAKRAASLAPRAGLVIDTLGWIEHLLGDDTAAASDLARAAELSPGQATIHLHAAIVYLAVGKTDRVHPELSEALRLAPSLEGSDEVRRLRVRLEELSETVSK